MPFKNLEGKLEKERPKRTISASGGLGLGLGLLHSILPRNQFSPLGLSIVANVKCNIEIISWKSVHITFCCEIFSTMKFKPCFTI